MRNRHLASDISHAVIERARCVRYVSDRVRAMQRTWSIGRALTHFFTNIAAVQSRGSAAKRRARQCLVKRASVDAANTSGIQGWPDKRGASGGRRENAGHVMRAVGDDRDAATLGRSDPLTVVGSVVESPLQAKCSLCHGGA